MSATTAFGSPVLGSPVLGSGLPSGVGRSVLLRRRATAAVVALLLAAVVVALVGVLLPRLAQADSGAALSASVSDAAVVQQGPALREHRVVPGDTLWGLAVEVSRGGDPREAVDRIMRVNSMRTPVLQVGETVLLPTGS